MKVVYHPDQKQHYPKQFLVNGCFQPNPEMPERLDRLLEGALAAGCTPETPSRQSMQLIEAVHSPAYLKFLEHAHERWMHIAGASDAVTPNIHPDSRDVGYPGFGGSASRLSHVRRVGADLGRDLEQCLLERLDGGTCGRPGP